MTAGRERVETVAARIGGRGPRSTVGGSTVHTVAVTTGRAALDPAAIAPAGDELELRATLGEGGMGVVQLATQRSLARDVAVKRVRDLSDDAAVAALVAEATVTGGLEHPAIVPVHALVRDARGPLMVMKRLDGVTLRTLITQPEHPRWKELGGDRLGFFVQVVRRLCDALALAASRGVVHRDVKPDNVMIGAYGEVYLLDWGIAVPAGQPQPAENVAGTPAYMAPEMLSPETGEIDARCDVYLLGATLHECVTGKPPHAGDEMIQVLVSALESKPIVYGSEVPAALAALLRKAMHRDRDERFADARALGRALDDLVARRAASALVEAADERRVALERAIAEHAAPTEVHAIFQACRFAYEHALRDWPEGPAREGRERALLAMTAYALESRDLGTARGLVAALGEAVPEPVRAKLAALERELAAVDAERARLRALERDHDIGVGESERRVLVRVTAVAVVLLLATLVVLYATGVFVPTPRSVTAVSGVAVALASTVVLGFRDRLLRNRVSRQIAYSVVILVGLVLVHRLVGVSRDQPLSEIASADAFIMSAGSALSALTLRRLLFVPALLFAAAGSVAPFVGDAAFVPVLGAGALSVLLLLISPRALAEPALGAVVVKSEVSASAPTPERDRP